MENRNRSLSESDIDVVGDFGLVKRDFFRSRKDFFNLDKSHRRSSSLDSPPSDDNERDDTNTSEEQDQNSRQQFIELASAVRKLKINQTSPSSDTSELDTFESELDALESDILAMESSDITPVSSDITPVSSEEQSLGDDQLVQLQHFFTSSSGTMVEPINSQAVPRQKRSRRDVSDMKSEDGLKPLKKRALFVDEEDKPKDSPVYTPKTLIGWHSSPLEQNVTRKIAKRRLKLVSLASPLMQIARSDQSPDRPKNKPVWMDIVKSRKSHEKVVKRMHQRASPICSESRPSPSFKPSTKKIRRATICHVEPRRSILKSTDNLSLLPSLKKRVVFDSEVRVRYIEPREKLQSEEM